MEFDVSSYLTGGGSRQVSDYDITLARDMFTLGFETGMFNYDCQIHWAEFAKDEMLSNISNDAIMKSLLSDIFESGKSLGLSKRKKKGPSDT